MSALLNDHGHDVVDMGTNSTRSCDYTDIAFGASKAVADGQVDTAVLVGPSHRSWVGDYAASTEDNTVVIIIPTGDAVEQMLLEAERLLPENEIIKEHLRIVNSDQ